MSNAPTRRRRARELRRLALVGDRGPEVRARADAAVEGGPALARGEALLEAVEASEAPAEIVDVVHERRLARARNDGAAVLERAVVAEDDVQHRLRGLGREAGDVLDLTADAVVPERDLAMEAAGVRHVDAGRVGRV